MTFQIKVKNSTKIIYQFPTNDTMPPNGILEGFREFNGCYYSDCYYTMNEKFFGEPNSIERFDAIIFPVPSFRDNKVKICINLNKFAQFSQILECKVNNTQNKKPLPKVHNVTP